MITSENHRGQKLPKCCPLTLIIFVISDKWTTMQEPRKKKILSNLPISHNIQKSILRPPLSYPLDSPLLSLWVRGFLKRTACGEKHGNKLAPTLVPWGFTTGLGQASTRTPTVAPTELEKHLNTSTSLTYFLPPKDCCMKGGIK